MKTKHAKGPDGQPLVSFNTGRGRGRPKKTPQFTGQAGTNQISSQPATTIFARWINMAALWPQHQAFKISIWRSLSKEPFRPRLYFRGTRMRTQVKKMVVKVRMKTWKKRKFRKTRPRKAKMQPFRNLMRIQTL